MQIADVETVRAVRRELARHPIDISEAGISANHGVVHLYGRVRPIRGHEADFDAELSNVPKLLRQHTHARDIIIEWTPDRGIHSLGATSSTRSRS